MTDFDGRGAGPGTSAGGASTAVASAGRSRWWTVGFGVVTVIAGILILIWPGATVVLIAIIFGIELLVAGIFWLVTAIAHGDGGTGSRVLLAILGVVAILVGVLCLRSPFQTVAVLTLIIGLFWLIGGVIEIFQAIAGHTTSVGWGIFSGLVSVVAGIVVLSYPISSVVALAWVFGVILLVYGLVRIVHGFVGDRGLSTVGSPGAAH